MSGYGLTTPTYLRGESDQVTERSRVAERESVQPHMDRIGSVQRDLRQRVLKLVVISEICHTAKFDPQGVVVDGRDLDR